MATFTNQKPFVATKEHCEAPWLGNKKNFRCHLCGKKFKPGDIVRWVFTNNIIGAQGNPLVCKECDTSDIIEKWKAMRQEFNSEKWWWFRRGEET